MCTSFGPGWRPIKPNKMVSNQLFCRSCYRSPCHHITSNTPCMWASERVSGFIYRGGNGAEERSGSAHAYGGYYVRSWPGTLPHTPTVQIPADAHSRHLSLTLPRSLHLPRLFITIKEMGVKRWSSSREVFGDFLQSLLFKYKIYCRARSPPPSPPPPPAPFHHFLSPTSRHEERGGENHRLLHISVVRQKSSQVISGCTAQARSFTSMKTSKQARKVCVCVCYPSLTGHTDKLMWSR